MMTPDVNVLVAASRADHPHHHVAFDWLDAAVKRCATGGKLVILPMVATAVVRLVTHPKVFVEPTPIGEAIAFVEALLAVPGVQMLELGREWDALCHLCRSEGLAGNDVPDAWIAAAVSCAGSHLVTFDRGFNKLLDRRHLTLLSPQR